MKVRDYGWLFEAIPLQYHFGSLRIWEQEIRRLRTIGSANVSGFVIVQREVMPRLSFEMRPEVHDGWRKYVQWADWVAYELVPFYQGIAPHQWMLKDVRVLLRENEAFSKALLFGDYATYTRIIVEGKTQLPEIALSPEQRKLFERFRAEFEPTRQFDSATRKRIKKQREEVAKAFDRTLNVHHGKSFELLVPLPSFLLRQDLVRDMAIWMPRKSETRALLRPDRIMFPLARMRPFERALYQSVICMGLVATGVITPVPATILPEHLLNGALVFVVAVFLLCLGLFAGANRPSQRTRRR